MTDVLKMNSCGFELLSHDEMMDVDGGLLPALIFGVVVILASTSSCGASKVATDSIKRRLGK